MSDRTLSRRRFLGGIATGTATATLGAGTATAADGAVGEVGRVTAAQPDGSTWRTVSLSGSYDAPVVVMQPLSHESDHPAHVRVRNVTADSFEFQIEEWQYLDGPHGPESVTFAVFECGCYTLSDGTPVSAGTIELGNGWKRASFRRDFDGPPVVLSQAQTVRGYQAVVTRTGNVTPDGGGLRLQEEETFGWHKEETVGYVAVGRGGDSAEVGMRPDVTDEWTDISFEGSYDDPPVFLADVQTFNGGDPVELRYDNLDASGVSVFAEEEQSADAETDHDGESVGYLAFPEAGPLSAE